MLIWGFAPRLIWIQGSKAIHRCTRLMIDYSETPKPLAWMIPLFGPNGSAYFLFTELVPSSVHFFGGNPSSYPTHSIVRGYPEESFIILSNLSKLFAGLCHLRRSLALLKKLSSRMKAERRMLWRRRCSHKVCLVCNTCTEQCLAYSFSFYQPCKYCMYVDQELLSMVQFVWVSGISVSLPSII